MHVTRLSPQGGCLFLKMTRIVGLRDVSVFFKGNDPTWFITQMLHVWYIYLYMNG